MSTLITGVAGFIGSHVAEQLLAQGESVIGIDKLDPADSTPLQKGRLDRLDALDFTHHVADICDTQAMHSLFAQHPIDQVIHLAAESGITREKNHSQNYIQTNLAGF